MIAPAGRCETNHIPLEMGVDDEWAQRVATIHRRGARVAYAKALAERYDSIYVTPEHTPEREMGPNAEPQPTKDRPANEAPSWYTRLWNFLFN